MCDLNACELRFCGDAMQRPIAWDRPPAHVAVASGQVHLWRARIDVSGDVADACLAVLSPDEQMRAERYRFVPDRNRFVVARALLRNVLCTYTRSLPSAVRFGYGPFGKPYLEPGQANALEFNLSHGGGLWLAAISGGDAIGVDVEPLADGNRDMDAIARHLPADVKQAAALARLTVAQRQRVLVELWTRTEAELKAAGCGWASADDLLRAGGLSTGMRTISFQPLDGYVASLAHRSNRA
jgi:4'-phosphopantetheinyl transferase